ncbi:MAG: hypothetical protein H6737_18130 [Alphaproteobacteria bacterium]|nr:hypothetical protein [Alphaproteobacteria bacterium]
MLWILAMMAEAAPLPLPAHVDAGPLEGFVAVWGDPATLPGQLRPVEPGPAADAAGGPHEHDVAPSGLAVLQLDEGVAQEAVLEALKSDPELRRAELARDGTGILVDHPDLVALLERPLGKGTVGDAVSMHLTPRGPFKMPNGSTMVDLPVDNVSSARAVVSIGGVEVGEVGPYARAVIHGVAPGTYELHFRLPNGYVRKARAHTGAGLHYEAPYRMR